jgi:hypothetical protein
MNDVLEDRLVLSHFGAVGVVHVDHAHPTPPTKGTPVLKTGVLNDVNQKIDLVFAQFNNQYKKEVAQVDRTGNESKFGTELAASVNKLKQSLDKQAARIPGGKTNLVPVLNARVDSLVHDLETKSAQSSNDLVKADQSGIHADVQTYVHDAVSKGDLSMK